MVAKQSGFLAGLSNGFREAKGEKVGYASRITRHSRVRFAIKQKSKSYLQQSIIVLLSPRVGFAETETS